jgi:hypothetical protein
MNIQAIKSMTVMIFLWIVSNTCQAWTTCTPEQFYAYIYNYTSTMEITMTVPDGDPASCTAKIGGDCNVCINVSRDSKNPQATLLLAYNSTDPIDPSTSGYKYIFVPRTTAITCKGDETQPSHISCSTQLWKKKPRGA